MSMIRCLRRSRAANAVDSQSRKRLEYAYSVAFADAQSRGAAHGVAETEANAAFDGVLAAIAAERRHVARLQAEAEGRLMEDASRFRNRKGQADIGEFALQLINHMHFASAALFRMDMAELGALAHEFQRTVLSGKRKNFQRADLMIDELFGVDTGDAAAQTLAQAWQPLSRRKAEQYNGAGGNIAVRENWLMPQRHDATTIGLAGFDEWRATILDTTAFDRMTNTDTGKPFTAREFEEALPEIFETITWHGLGDEAGMMGERSMALWKRRNDPRFFVFKDADAWRRYHGRFGGDMHPFEMMTAYLRSINHDIAAMQLMGPNPSRTVALFAGSEDMPGGYIMQAARDSNAGRPALFPSHGERIDPTSEIGVAPFRDWRDREQYAKNKSTAMIRAYRAYSGAARRPLHNGFAEATASLDNLMYASKLAFTPFLVGGDIVNQAATRAFNSVGVTGMMRDFVDALRLSRDAETLNELAIETDVGLSTMLSEARDNAVIHGNPITRYVADRALTFSMLKPMTMGLRAMWTLGVLHDITRYVNLDYDKVPIKPMLERYGIDRAAWEFIQATPARNTRGVNVIRPSDIAKTDIFALSTTPDGIRETVQARAGLTRGEEVALRVMRMIQEEGEAATVSGTPRSARIFPYRPGSISGLPVSSMARLKTYAVSHWQHHAYRAAEVFWRNGGGVRGMAGGVRYYALSLVIPSMVFIGFGTILADMAAGKNPPDITDWRFWDRVFWRTVSLGFFSDVFQGIFDPETKIQGASRFMGPTLQTMADVVQFGGDVLAEGGGAAARFAGYDVPDETRLGRSALRTVKNFVPRTWATDLAVDRLFWDNAQRLVDPEAEDDFQRRAGRVEQGMWAAPGQPLQAPDLSTLDLADADNDM